jgi:hypothetical protein
MLFAIFTLELAFWRVPALILLAASIEITCNTIAVSALSASGAREIAARGCGAVGGIETGFLIGNNCAVRIGAGRMNHGSEKEVSIHGI